MTMVMEIGSYVSGLLVAYALEIFLGKHGFMLFGAGLFFIAGAFSLITGMTGQRPKWMNRDILTDQEKEHIESLSGQTLSELDQLLEHQLKFDKLDEAEETSKLMLSIAEAGDVGLDHNNQR